MGIYTLGQRSEGFLNISREYAWFIVKMRLLGIGSGLGFGVLIALIHTVTEGPDELVYYVPAGYFVGEVVALMSMAAATIRLIPIATLVNGAIAAGWIYLWFRFGLGAWLRLWSALGLQIPPSA